MNGVRHRLAGTAFIAMVCAACMGQAIGTLAPNVQTNSIGAVRQLMREGKFAAADAVLRSLITADPNAPEPRYLLAYALLREDKPADSLREYTSAAALRTPMATELRGVALDYVLLNDLGDAERWMNRSLEMDPKDAETWYAMGRLRYTQGRYGDALTCFEKTLVLNPRSVKGENNLGLTYEALNRNDEAVQAYRAAIALQKNDPAPSEQPLLNLAILLLHRNGAEEAKNLLEQAASIAPHEPRIHENLGQIYLRTGDTADAVAEFSAAEKLAPQNPRYHFLLGQAYRHNGDNKRAQEEFAKSAALNGSHSTPERP